jgi:hypothetical protein
MHHVAARDCRAMLTNHLLSRSLGFCSDIGMTESVLLLTLGRYGLGLTCSDVEAIRSIVRRAYEHEPILGTACWLARQAC